MAISEIFAFLVHPTKNEESTPELSGVQVRLAGDLFAHLSEIFSKSQTECNIDVALRPKPNGDQLNDFRDSLLSFARDGTLASASNLAIRLSRNTTHRSGLGLFFAIRASMGGDTSVLLSRFPTDTAILVDDISGKLNVKFLDKVFVKTYYTYKAALFRGRPVRGSFWDGAVLDKQINSGRDDASRYWVHDFLEADFKTTSHHGSTRLARAISDASAGASFEVKREIHHLAALAENLDGRSTSVLDFLDRFGASEAVRERVISKAGEKAASERFLFSREAYNSVVSYRSVETAEGAIVTAHSSIFEEVFKYETLSRDGGAELVRLSTEGILAADKLKRSK
jgi:hypothetical protein